MSSDARRRIISAVFVFACGLSVLVALAPLALIQSGIVSAAA